MSWFDDDDLWILLGPTLRSTEALHQGEREAAQIVALAGIVPGTQILDAGSGPGRHSLALASSGFRVTAVDRTPSYLTHLAATAKRRGQDVEIVRRDLRELSRPAAYDAAVYVDVLGVFDRADEDVAVLKNLCQCLVPGGCLVVGTTGKEQVARHLDAKSWSWLKPGAVLLEERTVDEDWGAVHTRLTGVEAGRVQKYETTRRLYAASELAGLLDRAGFSSWRFYGDFEGRPYDRHARRLVAVAER
jgi:cyclopropane fatty-acyl-phospholipid synthase-like methyltransferase